MAETTIEWTATRLPDGRVLPGYTFNPWIGCTEVSAACDHCYARTLAERYGWAQWGAGQPRHKTSLNNWMKPRIWNRKAKAEGVRRRVFCASLADVFDVEVPDAWRADLFELIEACPDLDWLLLTKRPKVMAEYFSARPVPDNVWAGTTVEDQKMADLRIPELLRVPAQVRFLSVEPMLGLIDLRMPGDDECYCDFKSREYFGSQDRRHVDLCPKSRRPDWVICGGESGPKARPSHPDWFRSLRDECAAAGVPFLFKQHGEWVEVDGPRCLDVRQDRHASDSWMLTDGRIKPRSLSSNYMHTPYGTSIMRRAGKKTAGRLLDGVEHNGFPA